MGFATAARSSLLLNFTFKIQKNRKLEIDSVCRPMMGQHTAEIDVESLQRTGRQRRTCLDVFLVTSIIFLFLAVAAVVGMIVRETWRHPPEFLMPERTMDGPHFKVRIGSHLEKKNKKQTYFQSHFLSMPV